MATEGSTPLLLLPMPPLLRPLLRPLLLPLLLLLLLLAPMPMLLPLPMPRPPLVPELRVKRTLSLNQRIQRTQRVLSSSARRARAFAFP